MSERQAFGAWCLLDPVVTIGGTDYKAAVRFQSWPGPHPPDMRVVSGVVESITGTTTKRIVCKRGVQSSSYESSGTEVSFSFVAGGNVCATSEAMRHFWNNNGQGLLGDLAGIRAIGGEALWEGGRAFLVTAALALEEEPDEVAWQDGVAGPGRAPLCAGTVNLATDASTSVSENLLHWHDVVEIHDPNEECELAAGDAFELHRNAMFDSRNPPTVEYDVRDGGGTWAAMDAGDYLARWTEGLILITQAWIESEGWDTTPFCLRVEGVRFSQSGNMPARQVNDIAAALNVADELWVETTATGPAGLLTACSGNATMTFGPVSWQCDPTFGLQVATWGAGYSWTNWLGFGVVVGMTTVYPPYYAADYWTEASETIDDTSAGTLGCGGGEVLNSSNDIQPDKTITNVKNEADGGTIHGRDFWVTCSQVITSNIHQSMVASFNVAGIPFNPAGIMQRIPQGSTIVEAWARVKVDGLVMREDETNIVSTFGAGFPYYRKTIVNGVTTREYEVDATNTVITDTTASDPALATSGSVAFSLIGVYADTADVVDVNGSTITGVPNHRVESLGVGLSSVAADGEWALVNVTAAIQKLIEKRSNRMTGFYWWPSTGHVAPGASFEAMGAFVVSLFGDWSATVTYDGAGVRTTETTVTTRELAWDAIDIDTIHVRWRPPSGILDDACFPLRQPPMIPAA